MHEVFSNFAVHAVQIYPSVYLQTDLCYSKNNYNNKNIIISISSLNMLSTIDLDHITKMTVTVCCILSLLLGVLIGRLCSCYCMLLFQYTIPIIRGIDW